MPRNTHNLQSSAPQQRQRITPEDSGKNTGKVISLAGVAILVLSIFGPEFGIHVPFVSEYLSEWIGGTEARVVLQGHQKNLVIAVNGQTVARALPATLNGIPVGTPFRVTITGAPGVFQQEITLKKGEKKVIPVTFSTDRVNGTNLSQNPTFAPDKSILLKLNLSPGGGSPSLVINGKTIDPSHPSLLVPLDEPLELSIERTGYKSFRSEFVLQTSQVAGLKEWMMEIQLEPLQFGFLTIHTTPSANATILLDGVPWTKKTPIENEKFPAGDYSIRLTNEVLGMEKTISVSIQEGKSVNIDERLEIKN
jgi:hypothetical protein